MATLLVEFVAPDLVERATRQLQDRGARPVKRYPNVSRFMESEIWLFDAPVGTPIPPLATIPGVKYAEPDEEHIYVQRVPQLPFGTPLLSLGAPVSARQNSLDQIGDMIGLPQALERTNGGEGVIILIVDSGVDRSVVPQAQQAGGWTDSPEGDPWTDEFGHGSMCARIALHVAPRAGILSVKVASGPNGGVMKESVISAINDLLPVVDANPGIQLVMNNSWGTMGCLPNPYW